MKKKNLNKNLLNTVQNTPTNVIKFTRHEFDPYGEDLPFVHQVQSENGNYATLCGLNAIIGDCDFETVPLSEGVIVDCPKCKPITKAVQNTPAIDIVRYSIATVLNRLDMQTKTFSEKTGVNSAEIRAIKRQSSAISFERALTIAAKLGQTTAFLSEIVKESAKIHRTITGEKMKPIKAIQKEIF